MGIIPQLSGVAQGTPLERILDRLQAEAASHPMRRSQLMAIRFYLRDLITVCRQNWMQLTSGITNYFSLLDQLQSWRERSGKPVCIVTFNYDLLLEDALRTVGVDPLTLQGYVAHPDWKIIKPHGSVNWAREVDTEIRPLTRQALIARAAEGIEVSQRFVIDSQSVIATNNRLLFPALAIPVEGAKGFECPQEHLEVLRECIRQTTQILIVGWRATEKNFLEILARIMPSQMRFNLVIVCGSGQNATQTQANLKQSGVGTNATARLYVGGFTNLCLSEDLRTILL